MWSTFPIGWWSTEGHDWWNEVRTEISWNLENLNIQKFRVREFSKSVDIIKEGDDGDEIFVLEEGKIEVYYTEDDGSE